MSDNHLASWTTTTLTRYCAYTSGICPSVYRRPHNHWRRHGSPRKIPEEDIKELQDERSRHRSAIEYWHDHDEQRLIVGVYVDDLIITRGDMEVLERFKRKMSKNFKMSDLGVLIYYLGIEVQQSTTGIIICQSAYAKKLLDTTGLVDNNLTRRQMEARLQLRKANTTTASPSLPKCVRKEAARHN